jgi:hypothetical protein
VAGGRGRGGIHRRVWFHRSPAHPSETAGVAPPDAGDQAGGTADETAPPASFDQVLRRAAEAREAEREPGD